MWPTLVPASTYCISVLVCHELVLIDFCPWELFIPLFLFQSHQRPDQMVLPLESLHVRSLLSPHPQPIKSSFLLPGSLYRSLLITFTLSHHISYNSYILFFYSISFWKSCNISYYLFINVLLIFKRCYHLLVTPAVCIYVNKMNKNKLIHIEFNAMIMIALALNLVLIHL